MWQVEHNWGNTSAHVMTPNANTMSVLPAHKNKPGSYKYNLGMSVGDKSSDHRLQTPIMFVSVILPHQWGGVQMNMNRGWLTTRNLSSYVLVPISNPKNCLLEPRLFSVTTCALVEWVGHNMCNCVPLFDSTCHFPTMRQKT
jgi:hypothetical protein